MWMVGWIVFRVGKGDTSLTELNATKLDSAARHEFWTEERCFITELMNSPDQPNASLALSRVEPGVTTQLHALDGLCETYTVTKGTGLAEINGQVHRLNRGESLMIPAGASQRITNDGPNDLEFYCLCTPRFVANSYVNLES